MNYSSKELRNIKNSLKYWDISQGQKECVENLIKQAERVQELEEWQEKTQQLHESLKRQDEV